VPIPSVLNTAASEVASVAKGAKVVVSEGEYRNEDVYL
jgi:hypothetical protein